MIFMCLWLYRGEIKFARGSEEIYLFGSEKQMFYVSREENLAKIARRVKDYKVEELNPPREGKRLLVLDVDYTLFGELQWSKHLSL